MSEAFLTNCDEGYDVELEFNKLIEQLTEKEWENWCLSWFDKQLWVDTYKNWDTEIKRDTIEELKEIIKNRENGKVSEM